MVALSDAVPTVRDTSASHLTEHASAGHVQFLPSQQDYLQNLRPSSPDSRAVVLEKSNADCGICLEAFAEIGPQCIVDPSCQDEVIVTLNTCKHMFHYRCIARWHTSSRPGRNTCPNCRREMFVADSLTEEQIQQLARGTSPRREDVIPILQPNEMLVPWDTAVVELYARQGVVHVIAIARRSRFQQRVNGRTWIALCHLIRESLLPQGDTVRPVLQTHGHDFINVVIAAAVLCRIIRYLSATRMSALRELIDWVDLLIDTIGEGEFQTLYGDFRRNGLFETDRICVVPVTDAYVRFYLREVARLRLVSAEMRDQVQRPKWKETLRCIKHFAVRNLEPAHARRTNKTLANVLGRIPDGGLLHCLSRTPGQRSMGNGALGIAWDNVLMVETESGQDVPLVI